MSAYKCPECGSPGLLTVNPEDSLMIDHDISCTECSHFGRGIELEDAEWDWNVNP